MKIPEFHHSSSHHVLRFKSSPPPRSCESNPASSDEEGHEYYHSEGSSHPPPPPPSPSTSPPPTSTPARRNSTTSSSSPSRPKSHSHSLHFFRLGRPRGRSRSNSQSTPSPQPSPNPPLKPKGRHKFPSRFRSSSVPRNLKLLARSSSNSGGGGSFGGGIGAALRRSSSTPQHHVDDDNDNSVSGSGSTAKALALASTPLRPLRALSTGALELELGQDTLDHHHHIHHHQLDDHHVSFSAVHIQEYSRILGDHPCCSTGPPLSLGWHVESKMSWKLDEFETKRKAERSEFMSDLRLGSQDRRDILLSLVANETEAPNISDTETGTGLTSANAAAQQCVASVSASASVSVYTPRDIRMAERRLERERATNLKMHHRNIRNQGRAVGRFFHTKPVRRKIEVEEVLATTAELVVGLARVELATSELELATEVDCASSRVVGPATMALEMELACSDVKDPSSPIEEGGREANNVEFGANV